MILLYSMILLDWVWRKGPTSLLPLVGLLIEILELVQMNCNSRWWCQWCRHRLCSITSLKVWQGKRSLWVSRLKKLSRWEHRIHQGLLLTHMAQHGGTGHCVLDQTWAEARQNKPTWHLPMSQSLLSVPCGANIQLVTLWRWAMVNGQRRDFCLPWGCLSTSDIVLLETRWSKDINKERSLQRTSVWPIDVAGTKRADWQHTLFFRIAYQKHTWFCQLHCLV